MTVAAFHRRRRQQEERQKDQGGQLMDATAETPPSVLLRAGNGFNLENK